MSVVIPVRDGHGDLPACLDALARSTIAPLEVIVVDDGSIDDTAAIARARGAQVLQLPRSHGPGFARNRGVERARGDVVLFVDADVRVHVDTIGFALDALERAPRADAVLGSYDEAPTDPHFVSQYKNLFHHWVHQNGQENATTFWTGCGAIRRAVFLAVGGFNEGYRRPSIEDIELGARLRIAGHTIRLEKRMLAEHSKRWRLGNLLYTDLMLRGVPWIALMLRDRHSPRDLNLSIASKLATAFAGLFVLALLALPLVGNAPATLPALALLGAAAVIATFAGRGAPRTVAAVGLAIGAPALAFALAPDPLGALPLGLLLGLAGSHVDLYGFFARLRGAAFAIATLPMHLLFQLCCAASVPLGIVSRRLDRRRRDRDAEGPAVRELPPLPADDGATRAGA